MAFNLLSDVAIRNAKANDKLQSFRGGDGLYLIDHPNVSKYFQLRTTLHGKEKGVRLGIYPTMSLTDAQIAYRLLMDATPKERIKFFNKEDCEVW